MLISALVLAIIGEVGYPFIFPCLFAVLYVKWLKSVETPPLTQEEIEEIVDNAETFEENTGLYCPFAFTQL